MPSALLSIAIRGIKKECYLVDPAHNSCNMHPKSGSEALCYHMNKYSKNQKKLIPFYLVDLTYMHYCRSNNVTTTLLTLEYLNEESVQSIQCFLKCCDDSSYNACSIKSKKFGVKVIVGTQMK